MFETDSKRRELLPGPSVSQWSTYGIWALGVSLLGGVGALVCAFGIVARTERWDPVTATFVGLFLGGLGVGWLFIWMMNRKEKRELAAGYTTSAQGNNEVVRVHSPTGVVMREAGRPNLTKPEWEAAMKRVRAYQESMKREATSEPG